MPKFHRLWVRSDDAAAHEAREAGQRTDSTPTTDQPPPSSGGQHPMPATRTIPSFVPRTDRLGLLPCAEPGVDPDRMFFNENSNAGLAQAALLMCRRCPVRDACQAHARDQREWGIWGGEPESAREAPSANRSSVRRHAAALTTARGTRKRPSTTR
ncbi:WhiB family transcriptional regulator [Streptomyces vinaceus]|uniref:WhiB family transcriptional regulator n=1 Tax=Streptomyces vinaceus TaxID=1960 RepID=UPI0035DEE8D9